MNIREAAELLSTTRERVVSLIEDGIALPESGRLLQLQADGSKPSYDISEESLDAFLAAREKEDTGRYPRVAVRRELLVESGHRCAIDRERGPLQFHHIIEFAQVQHHDPTQMIAVCPTCHTAIHNGTIDFKALKDYKTNLHARATYPGHRLLVELPGPTESVELLGRAIEVTRDLLKQYDEFVGVTAGCEERDNGQIRMQSHELIFTLCHPLPGTANSRLTQYWKEAGRHFDELFELFSRKVGDIEPLQVSETEKIVLSGDIGLKNVYEQQVIVNKLVTANREEVNLSTKDLDTIRSLRSNIAYFGYEVVPEELLRQISRIRNIINSA